MKAFSELTARGQALRLRQIAWSALEHYNLHVRSIRLVANHLNTIFRVDTVDGHRYALRISHPTWRTFDDLRAELTWLEALHRDTDIGAPNVVPARDGTLITSVAAEGVPEPGRCVLFSWIPGVLLANRLTEPNLHALGVLAARLHTHAANFVPPADFTTRKMNGIYVRGEADVLFTDACADYFTPESRGVFERVVEQVQAVLTALYSDPHSLRVIHNDLHHENVKVLRGRLRPFDFEDTIWGYPVQDIAMTFYDLLDHADPGQTDYQRLRTAFQEGYTTLAEWPEVDPGQIDTLIAGRQVWRANWVARHDSAHAQRFIIWMASRFQVFLDTGAFPR